MRLFEALDKLNKLDEENGTANVGICNELVSVNKSGHNGTVTIGVPGEVAQQLALNQGNKRAILLIVDMDKYNEITNKQPTGDLTEEDKEKLIGYIKSHTR
ncbi:MAG: hypothetical protein P4L31_07685 [Candidatus Babeliales bacterium]|nr:hypothetical protein [Candidatus Babeliales bacterium]